MPGWRERPPGTRKVQAEGTPLVSKVQYIADHGEMGMAYKSRTKRGS